MENNFTFASETIRRARVKLTWAQVDIVSAKGTDFQLIIAGDADSVEELRVEPTDEGLTIAQPQLAYAKELLPRRRWLQICLRIPEGWQGDLDVDTVSGTIGIYAVAGNDIDLTSVSGSMSVRETRSQRLNLHTVSGAISGAGLSAGRASLRSVSGGISLSGAALETTKVFTISGAVTLALEDGSRTLDMQSVSGPFCVETLLPVQAELHSLSGQFLRDDGVKTAQPGEAEAALTISASTVSGDLAIKRRNP